MAVNWKALDALEFGDLEIPDDAVVLDAIVVVRYSAPEDDCPAFAFTSSTYDTALKIGILELMLARMKDLTLSAWRDEDDA